MFTLSVSDHHKLISYAIVAKDHRNDVFKASWDEKSDKKVKLTGSMLNKYGTDLNTFTTMMPKSRKPFNFRLPNVQHVLHTGLLLQEPKQWLKLFDGNSSIMLNLIAGIHVYKNNKTQIYPIKICSTIVAFANYLANCIS